MEARGDRIAALLVAFRGVLVDLDAAEQALMYEVARRHGRAPLDRGRALAARLRELEAELGGVAPAFDVLAAERGFRWAPRGEEAVTKLAASCRTLDVVPRLLAGVEIPVVAVAAAERELVERALRPLDGAFADLVCARGPRGAARAALARTGAPAGRVLYVAADRAELCAGAGLGMHVASAIEWAGLPLGRPLAAAR